MQARREAAIASLTEVNRFENNYNPRCPFCEQLHDPGTKWMECIRPRVGSDQEKRLLDAKKGITHLGRL